MNSKRSNSTLVRFLSIQLLLMVCLIPFLDASDGWKSLDLNRVTLHYPKTLSADQISRKIDSPLEYQTMAIRPQLQNSLNAMLLDIQNLLQLYPSNLKVDMYVYEDAQSFEDVYYSFYSQPFLNFRGEIEALAFYNRGNNSLHICYEDLSANVLSHEFGHAVIAQYFLKEPSVKVHEILAMYVEEELHRSGY